MPKLTLKVHASDLATVAYLSDLLASTNCPENTEWESHCVAVYVTIGHLRDLLQEAVNEGRGLRYFPEIIETLNHVVNSTAFDDLTMWGTPTIQSFKPPVQFPIGE